MKMKCLAKYLCRTSELSRPLLEKSNDLLSEIIPTSK